MRIGLNARFLVHPYTGIGQYTRNLILGLSRIDKENTYFLFAPEQVDFPLPDNFHIIRLAEKDYKSPSLRKAHWEHVLLPQEMQKLTLDVMHFLYPSNPNRTLPVPTVVTVHDVIPWRLPAYRKRLRSKAYHWNAGRAIKKANHIITVSHFSKDEIQKLFRIKENNVSVIYEAAPQPDHPHSIPSLNLRRKYILYVGGYDERKNVENLIIAYQKHVGNIYPIDLILVGGEDKNLERLITDEFCERVAGQYVLKPKGNLIFTESLSQNELVTLYKQAHLFVNVSRYEGFNLPLIEAMTYALPIVTSDIPVHREVTAGKAVFVDPNSIDSIGLGLHELLNHPVQLKDLAQKGKERSELFSWEKCAQETLDVYNLFG